MPAITPPIDSFKGEFSFLSNFYGPISIVYDGELYCSAEHAFQAAKCEDDFEKEAIKNCDSPGKAKKLGRRAKLVHNWEKIKLQVMYDIVKRKFLQNPDLAVKLLETKQRKLIEGNWWNDRFWGVCKGKGENHLGLILMRVRDELRELANHSLICRR